MTFVRQAKSPQNGVNSSLSVPQVVKAGGLRLYISQLLLKKKKGLLKILEQKNPLKFPMNMYKSLGQKGFIII